MSRFGDDDAGALLDAARAAFYAGSYAECLELCARVPAGAGRDVGDALLALRAESFRLTARAGEAVRLLDGGPRVAHSILLQCVFGRALLESGDVARAEDVLDAALRDAVTNADREEAALARALAFYNRRRFEDAERLLARVREADTIRWARRLEFEAWMAWHRYDFARAAQCFDDALACLARFPHEKRIELNLLASAAELAVDRLELDHFHVLSDHAAALEPIPPSLWHPRFSLDYVRSLASETEGKPDEALRYARSLTAAPLSASMRLIGACRRAAVLARYGEPVAYRDLVESIRQDFAQISLQHAPLVLEKQLFEEVAETLALAGDGAGAAAAMAKLNTVTEPLTPWKESLLTELRRAYVCGIIAEVRGNTLEARHRYGSTVRELIRLGLHRRAVIVALRLVESNRDPELLAYIDEHVRRLGRDSWIRKRFARVLHLRGAAGYASMSRAQREVLELLIAGCSTSEIAARRGRSEKTVRNTISSLLKAFGVGSRNALISECVRRGLAEPSAT